MFPLPRMCLLAGVLAGFSSCHSETASPTRADQLPKPGLTAHQILAARAAAGPILSKEHDGDLYFDERYLDSVYTHPWSARTRREMAIDWELGRLHLAKGLLSAPGAKLSDPVTATGKVAGDLVDYPSTAALLADIYRKIDSLKVLEHLPLTPHTPPVSQP